MTVSEYANGALEIGQANPRQSDAIQSIPLQNAGETNLETPKVGKEQENTSMGDINCDKGPDKGRKYFSI